MTTEEPWSVTGDLDPQKEAKEEADWELITRIREFGAGEIHRARSISTSWRWWSDRLATLAREIPPVPAAPRYLDECGLESNTTFGAEHINPAHLRDLLHRVVADADAVAAALLRSADQAEDRQRHALDIARSLVRTDTPEPVP